MSELLSIRPSLEVADLQPSLDHLVEVFDFAVEVHEDEMGLTLLHRDAVGLAVVRTPAPAVNETTAASVGVSGVEPLHADASGAARWSWSG